jgi:DNA-binding GntR family transcriptional regulator
MQISKTHSRADAAYDALTQAIYDGVFAPGAFIRIDQLAQTLQISITPTREAMARATAQRLLVHDQNRGFMVAPTLSPAEYSSLFSTRSLLEGEAARQLQRPREVAASLQADVERMRESTAGPAEEQTMAFSRADRAFHRELVRGAANPFLLIAWESLHFHLHVARLYPPQRVADAVPGIEEHQAIVDALAAGDVRAARAQLLDHVKAAEHRLRGLLAAASAS